MIDALTSAQIAMNRDKLALHAISQNISNSHTPGYKTEQLTYGAFDKAIDASQASVAQTMTVSHQQRQGVLDKTSGEFDFAIKGNGYFVVESDQGMLFTRRGDFHVNKQGELVTFDGRRVLGQGGSLRLDGGHLKVKRDGTLIMDNKPTGKFQLATFAHPNTLKSIGGGYFTAQNEGDSSEASCDIMQGFQEKSNVKSIDEMLEMTRISRHFQSSQRVMKISDTMLSQAISQLGEG